MRGPPTKMSIRESPPEDCENVVITLRGVKLPTVTEFDLFGGWLKKYRQDQAGKIVIDPGTDNVVEELVTFEPEDLKVEWKEGYDADLHTNARSR